MQQQVRKLLRKPFASLGRNIYLPTNQTTSNLMKPLILLFTAILLISASSCKKETSQIPTSPTPILNPYKDYSTYTIQKGKNYCDSNTYEIINGVKAIDFLVVFDSSCIYTTADPNNQLDINKLMGFSDCHTHHQANSARFGWNWMEGKLYLYAYCYNNSVRSYKTLTTVPLNTAQHLRIYPSGNNYIFQVNGENDTMPRFCSGDVISGYKLLPYFGGDEPAPHTINIKIKYQ